MISRSPLFLRHCEERSDEAIHSLLVRQDGLLRSARNDDNYFGRIASAVPWMKAWIFTTSASVSLPLKSGMP
jgi:hypothetical protein